MSKPMQRPKSLETTCKGGHDMVREHEAIWVSPTQYLYARYCCLVCGFAWDDPQERPSFSKPSLFRVEG